MRIHEDLTNGCAPGSMLQNWYFVVLNYHPMRRNNLNSFAALILLAVFVSACSEPPENSGSTNANAPQQANSNSGSQPQIAQNTPTATAPGSVPLALPSLKPQPAPSEKPATANARIANPPVPTDPNARVPKLVVPAKKIDFGKQPQEKTLVRAIVIKNGGRADLNIESVVPS